MRARVLAIGFWIAMAASTAAIPYIPPPQPVYEAPIDRALQNVTAMEGLEPLQRELLLARLNLLAYARNDGAFTYVTQNNEFNETGSVLCTEVGSMRYPQPEAPETFGPNDRCAALNFQLGPREETPASAPASPSAGALQRLHTACEHYTRALRLDSENLRARLGYAYVLDRLGRTGDARRELRTIIKKGMPRLASEHSEWEDHAVLTEAAAHLAHLATSRSDRARMERLRHRLEASQPIQYVTPIVVPMRDAPFSQLVDEGSRVAFDFAGTGDRRAQGWLTADAAWLVWDPEWRGQVRSGFDMIGQRTWSVFWSDGFEALRALDDNRDGELTGGELGGLSLWHDENRNGVSEPGEVIPANVHGIAGLSVRGTPTRLGLMTAPAGVRFEDGRTRPLYDWTPGLGRTPVSWRQSHACYPRDGAAHSWGLAFGHAGYDLPLETNRGLACTTAAPSPPPPLLWSWPPRPPHSRRHKPTPTLRQRAPTSSTSTTPRWSRACRTKASRSRSSVSRRPPAR